MELLLPRDPELRADTDDGSFCADEEELGEDDEAGLAKRTPSYWTPLNSIDTTSCWSPLEASPGGEIEKT